MKKELNEESLEKVEGGALEKINEEGVCSRCGKKTTLVCRYNNQKFCERCALEYRIKNPVFHY